MDKYSGRLRLDWGKTAWAATAGLGSKGLNSKCDIRAILKYRVHCSLYHYGERSDGSSVFHKYFLIMSLPHNYR